MVHGTVDSDTHVIESERTWNAWNDLGLAGEPPVVLYRDKDERSANWQSEWWLFDDTLIQKQVFRPEDTFTAQGARELSDVAQRCQDMDDLDVATQVVYSTYFISRATTNPAREASLCRCYNAWMASISNGSGGRIRWAAVIPMLDPSLAVKELAQASADGACAINVRGYEGDWMLTDARFFPVYEVAMSFDMPICIHSGNGCLELDRTLFPRRPEFSYARNKLPVIAAFSAIAMSDFETRFPDLRFGFIETGASWLPGLMSDLRTRAHRGLGSDMATYSEFLQRKHLYVACQLDEDLDYIVSQVGSECLVIGSDYGHADNASDIAAIRLLKAHETLSEDAKENITSKNPSSLYRQTSI